MRYGLCCGPRLLRLIKVLKDNLICILCYRRLVTCHQMTFNRQQLARYGEEIASEYIEKRGYHVLEKNYRKRYGELDIVALSPGKEKLVIVEVKTRYADAKIKAKLSLTSKQLSQLKSTTKYYKMENGENVPEAIQIDFVAITLEYNDSILEFEYIENISQ
jgi:putative endonuclease